MYKGYRRKVIVIKDAHSGLFESAYFVVRENAPEDSIRDMVSEASRIIDERISRESIPSSGRRLFAFSLGAAFFSVIFAATVIFLA